MKAINASEHIVYVVDDDARVRESIDDLLRSCGMTVMGFESAADYLEHEKPTAPACVILDIELPGISGLQLQQRLLGAPHPPIVFITGHGDVPSSVQAMKAGAIDFLPKPFQPAQLLAAVEAALALDRQRLAAESDMQALRERYGALTPREREVFPLIVLGLLNKQGAASLGISEVTYQIHRGNIMRKMAAHSVADLVRMSIKMGIRAESDTASVKGTKPNAITRRTHPSTKASIGIIDDDRRVLESLEDLLASAGYFVLPFASATAFFGGDAARSVACVISDICMPGMDGWAIEQRISKEHPDLPVILITGDEAAWAQGVKRLARAQKRVLLKKPFEEQQLLSAVAHAVGS